MPYAPHTRVTLEGVLSGSGSANSEIFSTGFAVNQTDVVLSQAEDAAAKCATWWAGTTNGPYISNGALLTRLRFASIAPDGSYAAPPVVITLPNPIAGGATSEHPFFLAVAPTLETSTVETNGRRVRGRMYLPIYGISVNGAKFTIEARDNIAQALASLMTDLSEGDSALQIVVASRSMAVNAPVDGITCDNIYDVQRRRKNRVLPDRSALYSI